MTAVLKKYATPLISGLFAVSLISGIALFLHVGQGTFREMHEWLSMVLIAPFLLHLWRNWRPFVNYFGRAPMAVALAASLAAAVAFAWPGGSGEAGGPPQFALARHILAKTPDEVAPLFGITGEALVDQLKARGITGAEHAMALADAAAKSGKSEFELVAALLPQAR